MVCRALDQHMAVMVDPAVQLAHRLQPVALQLAPPLQLTKTTVRSASSGASPIALTSKRGENRHPPDLAEIFTINGP
jgi:hypothetical protein